MATFDVRIPGKPQGQARGRAGAVYRKGPDGKPTPVMVNGRVMTRVHDDSDSRDWKATAQDHMLRTVEAAGGRVLDGPILAVVENVFQLPVSRHRKAEPRETDWSQSAKDCDNLAKAALDAANGVLWGDDREVTLLLVWKRTGAQGELPYVRLRAWELRLSPTIVLAALETLLAFLQDRRRRFLEATLSRVGLRFSGGEDAGGQAVELPAEPPSPREVCSMPLFAAGER